MAHPLVLMWHGFGRRTSEQDPYNLFVDEDAFARQLAHLRSRGSTFLDLDGFLEGLRSRQWPRRSVLVTIDDAYTSTLDVAAPRLRDAGIPALLFVPSARLGRTSDWMPEMSHETLLSASQLANLPAYGIEVGVHGLDHTLLPGLAPDELRRHVEDAREQLAHVLGVRPRCFAYPEGKHDAAARDAVRDAGYDVAFSVHEAGGRWAVPRIDVNGSDTERTFALKCTRWWPVAARVAAATPRLRRLAHRIIGSARR